MNLINTLIASLLVLTVTSAVAADEAKTASFGDAEVAYSYQSTETGMAILTLVALVSETNNSLRGLKNNDRRRLSKLGQLIYQCKLMLYKPPDSSGGVNANTPILTSTNYSLFTGVDLPLDADERVGVQAQALQSVDESSLFTASLGNSDTYEGLWETLGGGEVINLKQFNVNLLTESDVIKSAESIDIKVRFPVYQVEKPVYQWSYSFNLKDFKRAVQHAEENCTPARLMELLNQSG
jgi:hypothetical protein